MSDRVTFTLRRWRNLHRGLALSSLGVVAMLVLLLAPNVGAVEAQAAASPVDLQVDIAVDLTTPACYFTKTPGNHTSSAGSARAQGPLSNTHLPCPAGTIMGLKLVPLSEAIANHEPYVLPLSPEASTAQQRAWGNELEQLLLSKWHALQDNHRLSTASSCGYTAEVYGPGSYMYNDFVTPWMLYYVSSDCSSVYLDTVAVDVGYVPSNNNLYWYEFQYAAYSTTCWPPNDLLYPNTTYEFHPDQWHSAGYYGVYTFSWLGTPCQATSRGMYGSLSVGPIN